MRRILALAVLTGAIMLTPSVAEARFHIVCFLDHRLSDDPIVFPNQAGVSHPHDFFANNHDHSVLDVRIHGRG